MIEPGPFSLVVLPLLFGLFGFLEPCTKDSALVMVRQIERRSPQRKPVQMTISAPARALFLGSLVLVAAVAGIAFLGFQRTSWAVLGALHLAVGIAYFS